MTRMIYYVLRKKMAFIIYGYAYFFQSHMYEVIYTDI